MGELTHLDILRHLTHTRISVINVTSNNTHPFNGLLSSACEWQWHQLGHMQVCTSLQTDNHASTPPLSFYRPDAFLPPNQQRQSTEGIPNACELWCQNTVPGDFQLYTWTGQSKTKKNRKKKNYITKSLGVERPSWLCRTELNFSFFTSRLVLPFWYRLTQVVLEKRPLNGCSSVVVTGRMPFLLPNHKRQSTEGILLTTR